MAEWTVKNPLDYSANGDDIDSAAQKIIAETNVIYELLNRLRNHDAGLGTTVADTVAYSFKVDTSTSPATLYCRNGSNDGWVKMGTISENFGLDASELGGIKATGFSHFYMGKNEDIPSLAKTKDLYFAYDQKKVYIWENGGWATFLSLNFKDILDPSDDIVTTDEVAISGANKILRLDADGKAAVDVSGSPARIGGYLVNIDNLANGQVLRFNSETKKWENVKKDELTEAGDVSTTGEAGKIVRADDSGNMNANAKKLGGKVVSVTTLKDGEGLVYSSTADRFVNKSVVTLNEQGAAEVNITGNAAKVAGIPVKTNGDISDGQQLVYRAADNAFVNEAKGAVGSGATITIQQDGVTKAAYSGEKEATVNITTLNLRTDSTSYKSGEIAFAKTLGRAYHLYCIEGGISGVGEPDMSTASLGDSVKDGGVTWRISEYANTESPTLTGIPKAPTAVARDDTEQVATTKYVYANAGLIVAGAPSFYQRESLATPNKTSVTVHPTWVNIGGKGYVLGADTEININSSTAWDNGNYATAANRAGKDFYIYAAIPTGGGTSPAFVLSANSTVPTGYTATSSRKIGGFHCLCASVGTISGHTLSGYALGDILPRSMWDLNFRAVSENNGMVWVPECNAWVDIYMTSYANGKAASVYGGTMLDGDSTPMIHGDKAQELLGLVGKRLPRRDDFIVFAKGSNEGTNINGSYNPNTSGGHSDTAGRRMISNYGIEDCCGVMWQWGADIFEVTPGMTHTGTNQWVDGLSWAEYPIYNADIDGSSHYGQVYGLLRRVRFGGDWDDGADCGSRCAACELCPASRFGRIGARGLSELRSAS